MESARVKSSRRNQDRPVTGIRPMTSMRPMTSTGLEAPKTSRGKTALQRQIQDKSYWVGVLRAKINELQKEIAVIARETEEMAAEEGNMKMLKKRAEQLARELADGNLQLAIYNEYTDRERIGETADDVKEDLKSLKQENEELSEFLETGFEEQKRLEALIASHEKRLEESRNAWNNLLMRLDPQQQSELEKMEQEAVRLNRSIQMSESEISKLNSKRQQLEASIGSGSDSFLKKELVAAMNRLRSLEKQRDDLMGTSSEGDEKSRLLAQIRRDNKEVASMEARVAEVSAEMEELRAELEAYEDSEAIGKYRELREKEQAMDAFLNDFEETKNNEENTIRELGSNVNEAVDRISRMIAHIDGLKATSGAGRGSASGVDRLADEKRRLELDLSRIAGLEVKIQSELESLNSKIKTMESDIAKYSDIAGLQQEVSNKNQRLKSEREKLKTRAAELQKSIESLNENMSSLRKKLQSNPSYTKAKRIESELVEITSANERIRNAISQIDDTLIKKRVLDEAKKYNQKLQGF